MNRKPISLVALHSSTCCACGRHLISVAVIVLSAGIGATSTGHCHPKVVEAVRQQAGTIVHAQQNIFAGACTATVILHRRPACNLQLANQAHAWQNALGSLWFHNACTMRHKRQRGFDMGLASVAVYRAHKTSRARRAPIPYLAITPHKVLLLQQRQ